ncbi:PREDICTED: lipase 3-like [Rhagoletis zephyria]|uniref:lipase 3-like n=1 Tax=Rhagoletis zephyria TaxID=28612 RepID=UPI0008113AFD|nr:PREDICTED: lipase 3-like [Rhagoletis zephyria]
MACQCRKITTFVGLAVVVAFIAIALQQPSLEQFPDVGKTTHQIITSRGFEHEVHFIHTSDGYILQTTRIINPTVDYERLPVYVNHFMAGSSTRNYVQLLQQESIPTKYSYDDEEPGRNLREYKADFPSIYKLGNINSTDIALVYTKRDWYNHIADVHLLKESLNVKLLDDYQVPDQTWNHMELLWGKNVGKLVNERVLKLLAKY